MHTDPGPGPPPGLAGHPGVVLGGSPFPDRPTFAAAQTMTYVAFFNAARAVTMAADMYVCPRGLEWLPKPFWKQAGKPKAKK
jgi:hypothetical protein